MSAMINIDYTPYGSAKDCSLYEANWDGCGGGNTLETAVSWCASTAQAPVWAVGQSCDTSDSRLYDYWVKQTPYPFITAPTDQSDVQPVNCNTACGASPGTPVCTGNSVMVVGGSRDCGTATRSSHLAYCAAHTTNPTGDRELPHVVAPAYDLLIDSTPYVCGNGTSWSTAIVAGVAAQLIENNSSLAGWPEAIRAILMATSDETVDGGTLSLSDGTDDRDGAGEINAEMANRLAGSGNKMNGSNTACERGFDYGTITNSDPATGDYYSEVYRAKTTSSGKRIRIVLTWDGTATCTDPTDKTTCSGSGPDADFDLEVFRNGNLVYSSLSALNTFEFIEFAADANETYEVKIKAYSWTSGSSFFGIAWDTDTFPTT